jgi:hypothetical protein
MTDATVDTLRVRRLDRRETRPTDPSTTPSASATRSSPETSVFTCSSLLPIELPEKRAGLAFLQRAVLEQSVPA